VVSGLRVFGVSFGGCICVCVTCWMYVDRGLYLFSVSILGCECSWSVSILEREYSHYENTHTSTRILTHQHVDVCVVNKVETCCKAT